MNAATNSTSGISETIVYILFFDIEISINKLHIANWKDMLSLSPKYITEMCAEISYTQHSLYSR